MNAPVADEYPDLPPISLGDRIDLDDLQPEHFTITDADLAASRPAVHGLYRAVQYHLGHLGEDVVTRLVREYLQHVIDSGDVTASD